MTFSATCAWNGQTITPPSRKDGQRRPAGEGTQRSRTGVHSTAQLPICNRAKGKAPGPTGRIWHNACSLQTCYNRAVPATLRREMSLLATVGTVVGLVANGAKAVPVVRGWLAASNQPQVELDLSVVGMPTATVGDRYSVHL